MKNRHLHGADFSCRFLDEKTATMTVTASPNNKTIGE
jgi:hypothetical protein